VNRCNVCLAPIFYAFSAGGKKMAIDVEPKLEGDVVVLPGTKSDTLYAKVTSQDDCDAMYIAHHKTCGKKKWSKKK
jgi:hypothetical protein